MHPVESIMELKKRLDAIEARQRAYQMHDEGCPQFRAPSVADSLGLLAHMTRPACNCWLRSTAGDDET